MIVTPARAFDAEGLEGALGLRMSRPRERLGKREPEGPGLELPDGAIVIADEFASDLDLALASEILARIRQVGRHDSHA